MGGGDTVGGGGRGNRLHHILKVLTEVITAVGGGGGGRGGVWRWRWMEERGVWCESL